ncbi:hypothetical protein like AT5G53486 [Hibiscus trionum]|uniref:Uncharacterized protein n=1 Tax=Hibiscus trionum TaxID=183268 RepID=A0A9W7MLC3_HIBTR|nr:hypothetical protein like AT5G53486 [Hibiscus trionum]
MAEAFWFRAFLVVSLLLLLVEGFQQVEMEYSVLEQGGSGKEMIQFQMSAARRLLMLGGMLDYDDAGANPKHDPRKKPGKP